MPSPHTRISGTKLAIPVSFLLHVEYMHKSKGKKEVDLYSAFIVVPRTQGAQVWITQYYLQITPYLPLQARKRLPHYRIASYRIVTEAIP